MTHCLQPGTGLTPPFGANGVEFNNAGTVLFVANTATHQIIQIPVNKDGTAGAASIFITGINAPDGIAIDRKDNLWVCANQEDDIIVLDKTGKVIAKLGDFNGINDDGIVRGSAFPGKPSFQQGWQDTLRVEPDLVPALRRAPRQRWTRRGRSRSSTTRSQRCAL